MATYWITQVEQPAGEPIKRVCAGIYTVANGKGNLTAATSYTRQQVMAKIGTDKVFTAILKADGLLHQGAEVELTKDKLYITTAGNSTIRDNLGNLPACTC